MGSWNLSFWSLKHLQTLICKAVLFTKTFSRQTFRYVSGPQWLPSLHPLTCRHCGCISLSTLNISYWREASIPSSHHSLSCQGSCKHCHILPPFRLLTRSLLIDCFQKEFLYCIIISIVDLSLNIHTWVFRLMGFLRESVLCIFRLLKKIWHLLAFKCIVAHASSHYRLASGGSLSFWQIKVSKFCWIFLFWCDMLGFSCSGLSLRMGRCPSSCVLRRPRLTSLALVHSCGSLYQPHTSLCLSQSSSSPRCGIPLSESDAASCVSQL